MLRLEEVPIVIHQPVLGRRLSRAIVEVFDNRSGILWLEHVALNNAIVEQPIGYVRDDQADFTYTLHSDQLLIGTWSGPYLNRTQSP